MGDIREGAAVHERGSAAEGLDQVRQQRVLEQHRDRPAHLEVRHGHRRAVVGEAHDDPFDPLLQVLQVRGQAQHRHDLRGDDDVEAVLARHALRRPA